MAKNLRHTDGEHGIWHNTVPTSVQGGGSPASGLACMIGEKPGVCLNNAGEGNNDAGACDIQTFNTFDLEVVATAALAVGATINFTGANTLSDGAGTFFGYLRQAIAGAGTETVKVSVGR